MEISLGPVISSKDIEFDIVESSNELNIQSVSNLDTENENITPVKGKLCLNMIVKNESKIIERLLTSVLPIIDTYCICDTGSTDNTKQIIREFMKKHKKPGIVFTEPFKNFGYNRTVALNRAEEWGEYALLLDADMKLVISPAFFNFKNVMDLEGYQVIQKNTELNYYNIRIAKTGIGVKCVSPTHEYYDFPQKARIAKLELIYIDDIGDGGAKADKFTRDIRLLKQGIEEEPNNSRYYFYLANSYKNVGKFNEAIEMYKKRIEHKGWIEEVFYSFFEIGNCYHAMNEHEKAVYYWLEAWNAYPKRSESIYEITKHYRIIAKHNLAQLYCDLGKQIPYPKDDVLFIRNNVYEYLFEYEQSILSYYTKVPLNYYSILKLIGKNYNKENILSNYAFYTKRVKNFAKQTILLNDSVEKEIAGVKDNFVSSSPCIIPHKDGYMMNIRYVNYNIKPDGSYAFKLDDGKIRTLNKVVYLNKEFKITQEHWFDKVHDPNLRYQGVEDVKLFQHKNNLYFSGTVENKNKIGIGYGKCDFDKDMLEPINLESPQDRFCEKNWVFFTNSDGEMKVIYEWFPLTIGDIDNNQLKNLKKDDNIPEFFKELRGSTNGFKIGDEIWFLCHMVHHSAPRNYYHIIVILNSKTLKVKKFSTLFKLDEEPIEYCLGMIVEPRQIIFSYSTMDRTTKIATVSRNILDKELFP